jgi:2-methylaconitate cis-trans-isomerase PrpF
MSETTHRVRCVIMRGGTSKAVFLKEADLPSNQQERQALILSIFGSPDPRQIDGLGGADPLTSKVAIIGPPRAGIPRAAGAHLTYTFGQVGIRTPDIDYLSLCGNISSAVGAFAVYEGMVEPTEPVTIVRAYNTNLDRVLTLEVPVCGTRPVERGDYTVPGVPGTGAKIVVDLAETAGSATGALLPTGHPIDLIEVGGIGTIEMSLVDIGNAHVFVRARDVGLTGVETAAEIDARVDLRERLEQIRAAGAHRMGLLADVASSREETPAAPLLAVVNAPTDYRNDIRGTIVRAAESDLTSRLMFMQQAHKTYAGTSTVCTGVASRIPGTIVHELTRPESRGGDHVRIGHPAGVIETLARVESVDGSYVVRRATLGRTARRIMEGYVFVPAGPRGGG